MRQKQLHVEKIQSQLNIAYRSRHLHGLIEKARLTG